MLQVEIQHPQGKLERLQVPDDCVIGKGAQNEVRLDSWRIGKEHARLFKTPSGVLVEDLGAFGGVTVNGGRIDAQYGPLKSGEVIGIGPFKLSVRVLGDADMVQAAHPSSPSHTAAARNQMATEALQASRIAAERAQREAARSDAADANTARARVQYMLDQLDGYIKDKDFSDGKPISLDIVGFSRGAAEARDFANRVPTRMVSNDWGGKAYPATQRRATKQAWSICGST